MGLRYDLVYTTKELSRVLCAPTKEANLILQRALQYVEQTQDAELTFDCEHMLLFRPPKTRKKPTDIVNSYETEDYCLSDGIRQPDDFTIKQDFIYDGPPLTLMCQTDIDLGGQLPTRQSTSGYLLYIQGQLFHWRGRTEKLILTGEYVMLPYQGETRQQNM